MFVSVLFEGFDMVVGDRGYWLFGGEKQWFAFVWLLLKVLFVVVFDEVMVYLDFESEVVV